MSIDPITQRTIYYHMEQIQKLFKKAEITVYIHNPDISVGDSVEGDLLSSSEESYSKMHERMGKFIKAKGIE